MEKLIYADELRPGDSYRYQDHPVLTASGTRERTGACGNCQGETVKLLDILVPGGFVTVPLEPRPIVRLVHRPWPPGKTATDMLARIRTALKVVESRQAGAPWNEEDSVLATTLTPVHEAIEAYELGLSSSE